MHIRFSNLQLIHWASVVDAVMADWSQYPD